jgi:hypothetical protein
MDTLVIHCVAAIDRSLISYPGPLIYAGTDKGLYAFMAFSGRPNAWVKIIEFPQAPVWDLLLVNRILYAGTNMNIYRSRNPQQSISGWDTLDVTLPLRAFPSFRCLASDPDNSDFIYAGSPFWGPLDSWSGVVRSLDQGNSWEIWSQGWNYSAPNITALGYYMDLYLAGTDNDIYARDTSAEGWKKWGFLGGLENREIRDLHTTYNSKLYAATDSGVYHHYAHLSSNPFRLIDNGMPQIAVNALESNDGPVKDSLFAGTADGLYLYTDHDSLGIEKAVPANDLNFNVFPNPFYTKATIFFNNPQHNASVRIISVDGKEVAAYENVRKNQLAWDASDLPNGFYVVKVKAGNKVFKKCICLTR